MRLTGPGGTRTVVTAADGSYIFRSLAAGTYQVTEVVPPGWTQTTPTPGTITLGPTDTPNRCQLRQFPKRHARRNKFNDLNGNGVFDTGDTGLSGFTFDLINAATSAVVAKTTATPAESSRSPMSAHYPVAGLI